MRKNDNNKGKIRVPLAVFLTPETKNLLFKGKDTKSRLFQRELIKICNDYGFDRNDSRIMRKFFETLAEKPKATLEFIGFGDVD